MQTVMETQKMVPEAGLRLKSELMSASDVDRTLVRLAYQVVEENGVQGLGLIGIRRRGVPMAERMSKMIAQIEKGSVTERRAVGIYRLYQRSRRIGSAIPPALGGSYRALPHGHSSASTAKTSTSLRCPCQTSSARSVPS